MIKRMGTLLLLGVIVNPANGQFTKQINFFNPSGVESVINHRFAFGDLDSDGDDDMIVGEYQGRLLFYRNTGSPTSPEWTQELSLLSDIHIPPISGPPFTTPHLADVDDDGDLDLIVGVRGSSTLNDIYFFRNTGNQFDPSWQQDDNFIRISEGEMAVPFLIDLDHDGDLDLVIGDVDGTLHYYQNVGDAKNPAWVEDVTFFLTPTYIDVGSSSSPTFADLDNDSDFDLLIGAGNGQLVYYENQGSADAPRFLENTTLFPHIDAGNNSNPTLIDLDGDADFDLIIGNWEDGIVYFENTGTANQPEWTRNENAFAGFDIGFHSAPAIYDVNNDGLPDLVLGKKQSSLEKPLYAFVNNGTRTTPIWEEHTAAFPEITDIFDRFVTPVFVDLDADGDEDFVSGAWDGRIYCFENTGTKSTPVWQYRPLWFLGIDIGNYSIPAFADLDADGDYDLTVGEDNGRLACFWNRGTPQALQFDIEEADTSIYSNIDVGSNSAPAFMDIDGDGDLDLIVGEYEGILNLFENTGDAFYPFWEQKDDFFQEMNFDIDWFPIPKVYDLNGDGNQDLIIGEQAGTLKFYINDAPPGDNRGPSFQNFSPSVVYDTTSFYIRGIITDDDGVYDDNSGTEGLGVYLLWDNDGELVNSANEVQLNRTNGDTFRTTTQIPAQIKDADVVYRVFANDNSSGAKNPGTSSLYRITILDDDTDGPAFIYFSPDTVDENMAFYIETGLSDASGYFDDESTADGQGAFLRWDTDDELIVTYYEAPLSPVAENLFRTNSTLLGQANRTIISYQVYIFDNDFDNQYPADRTQGISNIRHIYIHSSQSPDDDDVESPTFANITTSPAQVYDTTSFFIMAEITDPSGVFDDHTGSDGQGVHIRWDTDGELTTDYQEQQMSLFSGDIYRIDSAIPSQFWGIDVIFQIYAYDDDFDNADPADRKLGVSSIQTVNILDDDTVPPVITETIPAFVGANTPFLIRAIIHDSSGIFDDETGSAGQGVFITWDTDGELLLSSKEMTMKHTAGDTFEVDSPLPGPAPGSEFVFNIVAFDNDFDNEVAADRLQSVSQVRNVVIYNSGDADIQGPTFSNWQPLLKYDDESFILSGEIYDPAGIYDDATGSDGKGIYLLWDTDGELTRSANELQVDFVAGNTYQTVDSIASHPANVNIVYQVFARDNDTNNGEGDRSLGISMAQVVKIIDDDDSPPIFSDFSPMEVFDSTEFYIECNITDVSEIYDDDTDSEGFGIYLLMDTDGELSTDANEIKMEKVANGRYRSIQSLHIPKINHSLVYQVFAHDNDFDNQDPADRKQGVSLAQSIFLRDDDTEGPGFSNFTPAQITPGISFYIECDIVDSSGVFDDETGSGGQGVYLVWDRDGELDETAIEVQMDPISEHRFRTVSVIDGLARGDIFVCQIFAYDNDFDNAFTGDRKQAGSSIRQIDFSNTGLRFIKFGVAPNPFTDMAYFIFNLSDDADVEVELFTLSGERVIKLNERYTRGSTAEIIWNGTNEAGNELASGVYMFRFIASANESTLNKIGKIAIIR